MFYLIGTNAQFGIKAGVNFANVTNSSSFSNSNRTGFMAGVFFAPYIKTGIGYRTEINYSKQGYDFKNGTNTGSVNLDYILLPQLTTINLSKYFTLLFGFQVAFLVNAKADSTGNNPFSNTPYGSVMDYYNKFDYGIAGGIEANPIKNLFIGGRYNASLGKNNNQFSGTPTTYMPVFLPNTSNVKMKNNVVQLYAGLRF